MILPVLQVVLALISVALQSLKGSLEAPQPAWLDVSHMLIVVAVLVTALVILAILSQSVFTESPAAACALVISCGTAIP